MVAIQLAGWLLTRPDARGSNPVVGHSMEHFYSESTKLKKNRMKKAALKTA